MAMDVTRPPYSNTGVTRTSGLLIDWLEWTTDTGFGLFDFLPELRGVEEDVLGHGMYAYRQAKKVDGVLILFDGVSESMGKHFSVSGDVLRRLQSVYGLSGYDLVSRVLKVPSCHVTRVDMAIDAVNQGLTRERIQQCLEDRWVVTPAKSWDVVGLRSVDDASYRAGWTIYVGARASQQMVRIYDKKLERLVNAGQAVAVRDWVRFEWVFRHDKAQAAAEVFVSGGIDAVLQVLLGVLDFVEPVALDTNRRRWSRAPWYAELMGQAKRGRLFVASDDWDVEGSYLWLQQVCAKVLGKVALAQGRSGADLGKELVQLGESKMTEADWADVVKARGGGQ